MHSRATCQQRLYGPGAARGEQPDDAGGGHPQRCRPDAPETGQHGVSLQFTICFHGGKGTAFFMKYVSPVRYIRIVVTG